MLAIGAPPSLLARSVPMILVGKPDAFCRGRPRFDLSPQVPAWGCFGPAIFARPKDSPI